MGPNTTFWVISRRFGTFCSIWRRFEIFDFFDFLVVQGTVCGDRQLGDILGRPRTKQGCQDADEGTCPPANHGQMGPNTTL